MTDAPTTTGPGVHPPPARRSAWTTKQKLVRLVWDSAGRILWRLLPPMRATLLRLFGGKIGPGCRLPGSVAIAIPWNLDLGRDVEIGDDTILYALGPITLGDGVVLDYGAHLCAGTHDMRDSRFPLLRPPINIGAGSFIGADAFIGPGVTLGARCRVWPRASVYRNAPDDADLRGNPARSVSAAELEAEVNG